MTARLAEWGYAALLHGWKIRGANPPDAMLVLHGTEDEQAPVAGMRQMEARMRALGKACEFRFYDGARHGFAVRTHPGYDERAATPSFAEARRFLATHLTRGS